MSDDIDAALAALEEAAPATEEPANDVVAPPAEAPPEGDKTASEPTRIPLTEAEKARRYDQQRGAVREERQLRRASDAQLQEARAQADRMELAFQRVQEQMRAPPQQPQYEEPIDPLQVLIQERNDRVARDQHQQQQTAQQREQQARQDRQYEQLQTATREFENDFREEQPDYDEALGFLSNAWDAQFELMGYPPEQRQQLIRRLFLGAVSTAMQSKRDPARSAYEAAKRVGYAAPAAAGAAATDKLNQVKAGQQAAKTLSGGGSAVQGSGISLKAIANLEGAAFDSAMAKLRRDSR